MRPKRNLFLNAFCLSSTLAALFILTAGPGLSQTAPGNSTGTLSLDEVRKMPKLDVHAHIMEFGTAGEEELTAMFDRQNMKWLDICTYLIGEGGRKGFDEQVALAERFHDKYPAHVSWASGLGLDGWNAEGWLPRELEAIRGAFDRGAVAVKVWKDIGMTLKDPDSSYVMLDDPRFDPVFDYIEKEGRTLVAHIGEPLNCWLPLDSMTTEGDRGYYVQFPQYHCFQHPEIPGYWKQVEARDRVLAKHPGLRVVGCHLGSLESDVDQLAARLDRYPNFAVDMAGRIVHFQVQDRQKVRDFILKYQDRLLYGTDNLIGWSKDSLAVQIRHIEKVYDLDYRYLAGDQTLTVAEVREGYQCRGLALPAGVLRKIYYGNAVRWYPGI